MAELSGVGDVAYINQDFITVKHTKNVIYIPSSILSCGYRLEAGDFVSFKAKAWDPPTHLKQLNVTHKAISASFKGRGKVLNTVGIVENLDKSGEFAFVRVTSEKGEKDTVFCTRITVKPLVTNMHDMFKMNDQVRVLAKEQQGGANNVKYRSAVITNMKHIIDEATQEVRPFNAAVKAKVPTRAEAPASPMTHSQPHPQTPSVDSSRPSSSMSSSSGSIMAFPPGLNHRATGPTNGHAHSQSAIISQSQVSLASTSNHEEHACCVPFDPTADPFEEELRKLRTISHYLTGYRCKYCLTN